MRAGEEDRGGMHGASTGFGRVAFSLMSDLTPTSPAALSGRASSLVLQSYPEDYRAPILPTAHPLRCPPLHHTSRGKGFIWRMGIIPRAPSPTAMTARVFSMVAMVALIALFASACDQGAPTAPAAPQSVTLDAAGRTSSGLVLPMGTILTDSETADGQPFVHYQLPEGYALIAKRPNGDVSRATQGGIKCTCTSGDGECMPFRATSGGQTVVGCAHNGCSDCLSQNSLIAGPRAAPSLTVLESALVARLDAQPEFVIERAELDELQCGGGLLFEDPELAAELVAFVQEFQRESRDVLTSGEVPETYTMAPVRAYGAVVWVPVMREGIPDLLFSELMWDRYPVDPVTGEAARETGGGSCSCDSSDGECEYKKERIPIIGQAEWCDPAGCTTCALS